MTECAICYVGDINFLLPALVSAGSVRKFVTPEKADIYIFVIDGDETKLRPLADYVKPEGIHVMPMNSASFSGFDEKGWNVTHVPKSALGRFFIADILPPHYKRILYLDGDTLVVNDPSALIEYPLPEGKLAAVEDKQWFCRHDVRGGKEIRDYFRQIGVKDDAGYFNSGVFLVGRETWARLAREAYQFFKNNVELCKFHDQSALNAVIGDRRLRLSLAWNFQTPYRSWGFEKIMQPRICHFLGPRKPWMGPFNPWAELFPLYEKEMARFASFNLPRRLSSDTEVIQGNKLNARGDIKLKYLYPFRASSRRKCAEWMESAALLS